jgi:hypothetical protein
LVQVPKLPAMLHARQAPVHDVLQHRPSTQLPDAHSQPELHVLPFDFSAAQVPVPELEVQ